MMLQNERLPWMQALSIAADRKNVALPPVTYNAMAAIAWRGENTARQVTLRHSLRPADDSITTSVLWGFWDCDREIKPVALLRENSQPDGNRAEQYVLFLRQWLFDNIPLEKFRDSLGQHSGGTSFEDDRHVIDQIIWIGPGQELGIEVRKDGWRLLSGYNVFSVRRKTEWKRSRRNGFRM